MSKQIDFQIFEITSIDEELWGKTAKYAEFCSWQPTESYLSTKMKNNDFLEWERVFTVLNGNVVIGFCAFTKDSAVLGETFSPYLGFLFVDESFRGNNISKKMCDAVVNYAHGADFDKVYLYSDLTDFYEKLEFAKIGEEDTPWGIRHSIYVRLTK